MSPVSWSFGGVLFSLCLASAPTLAAPSPVPDTPAGRRFADLMRLVDAGDKAGLRAYANEHFTEAMRKAGPNDPGIAAFLADQVERFGGFENIRVVTSTDAQLTMLVRPRSQATRFLRYVVNVEAAPPHRVQGLFLMPAVPDDIPREGDGLTAEDAIAAFAREVDRVEGFSGVVLLARGGEVVFERASGEADRDHRVAVTADTVFNLASLGKMFTAVAIGRLVDQGRVSWDDPVEKHVQGWLPEAARAATIHDLLTHTSGLGDYLDRVAEDPQLRNARSLSAYREMVRASAVQDVPDGGLRYSNAGYVVLGALLEAVTGRDYFDLVRDEVFGPAGMTRTGTWCRDEIVPGRAIGYIPPDQAEAAGLGHGWRTNELLLGARGTSAGGAASTARDLLRFARALVEGRLLRRETLDALLTPKVRFLPGSDYAYGFVIKHGRDGERVFGHAGGFPGVDAEIEVRGDGAWTLAVLSNVSGGAGEISGAWGGLAAQIRP